MGWHGVLTKPFKKLAFHGDDIPLMFQQLQDHIEEWIDGNTFLEQDDEADPIDVSELVEGPDSSTDNALARYDGTTGKLLQDSLITIDDDGDTEITGLSGGGHQLLLNGTGAHDTSLILRVEDDPALQWKVWHDQSAKNFVVSYATEYMLVIDETGSLHSYAATTGGNQELYIKSRSTADSRLYFYTDIGDTNLYWFMQHDHSDHDFDIYYGGSQRAKFWNEGGLYIATAAPATPEIQTLYEDTIIKCQFYISSSGTIYDDVNVSSWSQIAIGHFRATFARAMANANYGAAGNSNSDDVVATTSTRSTAYFQWNTYDISTAGLANRTTSWIIVGNN
jgi:hypothetical protein